jgi:hypothetical protein
MPGVGSGRDVWPRREKGETRVRAWLLERDDDFAELLLGLEVTLSGGGFR